MPPKRRRFERRTGERRYRKLFVIAVEGAKTEPQYFALFYDQASVIRVNCLRGRHDSSPPQVLKRMERYLQDESLKSTDEAWLVVDKDQWTDEQLALLHTWAMSRHNYGLALSNPKFEYWLLLHFEDGTGVGSSAHCGDRLRQYLPYYDKAIDARQLTRARILDALDRARRRDYPPCVDWPRALGGTTVYRLVAGIMAAGTSAKG